MLTSGVPVHVAAARVGDTPTTILSTYAHQAPEALCPVGRRGIKGVTWVRLLDGFSHPFCLSRSFDRERVREASMPDTGTHPAVTERNLAERKLVAIDKAILAHRTEARHKPYPTRTEDLNLYRRVDEILEDRV
jgi:hypothetical protein